MNLRASADEAISIVVDDARLLSIRIIVGLLLSAFPFTYTNVVASEATIFLEFDADPDFPKFDEYPEIQTSPLEKFDATILVSTWGEAETEQLKHQIAQVVENVFTDFGVVVTRERPTDGQPFQTVGIDSTRPGSTNAIGLVDSIDSDPNDGDFVRIWASSVLDQGFIRLMQHPDDIDFWANVLGVTIAHEVGHNYGLTHCDATPNADEQARGEFLADHIMQGGDFGCFWDQDDVMRFWNNDFEDIHFSLTSIAKLNDALEIDDAARLDSGILTDRQSRVEYVHHVMETWIGDSNLDFEFNSGDLVAVFSSAEYEDDIDGNSIWARGDWDGNGDFETSDLVFAFQDGGYEQGRRRPNAVNVPEPSSIAMLSMLGLWFLPEFPKFRGRGFRVSTIG